MYRRVVSLLLLPCVLLSQSAALGHSHGGSEPAGHDLRPHFHTNRTPAPHEHGHHHGPGGHHHHHGDGDGLPETDSQPTPQPEKLPGGEHDSDAVFIDRTDAVLCERSAFGNDLAASLLWAAAVLHLPTLLCADPPQEAAYRTHAPPPRGYACPLYLWQLSILI